MLFKNISLPAIQPFASRYLKKDENVLSNFHYTYDGQEAYAKRLKELQERSFMRAELADCIEAYMKPFPSSEAVEQSLADLRSEGVVVIGGQQAGLLTGPLYSIHKVISTIHLAKVQSQELNVPVIPVFWIAGEDHDFMEINHVYVERDGKLDKKGYSERVLDKRMASDTPFEKTSMKKWVRSILREFGETSHTADLMELLDEAIETSDSMTSLFAFIIMSLFKEEGLLVIDSADKGLRNIEQPFFQKLFEHSDSITTSVLKQQEMLKENGYHPLIDIANNAVNLFVNVNGERILLVKTSEGYQDKNGGNKFTHDELEELIKKSPHLFSNNVVTRPLMQEWLFPSLSFIAGPGEIAYWAELKSAFEKLDMTIPPIMPRLNMTIVERDIQQKLSELNLSIDKVLSSGIKKEKQQFWAEVKDETIEKYIEETQNMILDQYRKMKQKAQDLHPGLPDIVEKNLAIHEKQLTYLKRKANDYIAFKHQVELLKYDQVESRLRPDDGPQERIWNVFYFMNKYGIEFVSELVQLDFQFDHNHKVVYV
ncbi:bacillithiol biosynthesis cysteine-adding enzyme BshC [Jeotgalibacillus proteolyticus]|uniref:bacillithiol biosynthesis cysteine-adding enzyme BshC n=1 Tax=Jeotgalibacillus proteolyticus TaxID=2082395 RepID=UPI003CECC596